jgi:hypothetical protein
LLARLQESEDNLERLKAAARVVNVKAIQAAIRLPWRATARSSRT